MADEAAARESESAERVERTETQTTSQPIASPGVGVNTERTTETTETRESTQSESSEPKN